MKIRTCLWPFIVLIGLSSLTAAQESTCPEIVNEALTNATEFCGETARNQACYGHATLQVDTQPDVTDLVFDDPGDIVDVAVLQALRLMPMDEAASQWGLAVMMLQANLPDTLPGQNVTVLLFGDVQMSSADTESAEGAPMRAFYLRSGVGEVACVEAPESGILVQTPQGATRIELTINEVNITLGSTVFFQAQASGDMRTCTLEGAGHLSAFGQSQLAPAGTCVRVPLDETLAAAGPPGAPEPYEEGEFDAVPLGILNQPIALAAPLTEEEIAMLSQSPRSGTWVARWGPATISCEDGSGGPIDLSASDGPRSITFAADGSGAELAVPGGGIGAVPFMRTGPVTYYGLNAANPSLSEAIHWSVVDAEHMQGFSVIDVMIEGVACRVDRAPFTLDYEGE